MEKLWFRLEGSLNLDSLVLLEALATKDMLELGIWYHEWDDNRTVVWVANRNFPSINAIGVFNATEELGLMVLDTTGKEYWSSDIGTNPFHMGLLAFTEFLKLQPPAVFQQGFDCFRSKISTFFYIIV
uniref:Bulb-type lectin domain-containing protein n=1 Tax=Quercus lobata TaxID=97700 RepID=A0A7N2N7Y5_QUELO